MANWLSRRRRKRAGWEDRNRIGTEIALCHACKYSNYKRDSEEDKKGRCGHEPIRSKKPVSGSYLYTPAASAYGNMKTFVKMKVLKLIFVVERKSAFCAWTGSSFQFQLYLFK